MDRACSSASTWPSSSEVDRQGSLTAAADALCLTQSALSHSVRKLEQQLGTRHLAARRPQPAA